MTEEEYRGFTLEQRVVGDKVFDKLFPRDKKDARAQTGL